MATKINQSYYGTSDNWSNIGSDDVKRGGTALGKLITDNTWNIANNDNIDTTIAPWGVGESSVSALGFYVFGCDGRGGTNYGGNLKYENNTSGFRNMPIMFCNNDGITELDYSTTNATRNAMIRRVVGNTYKQSGDNNTTLRSNANVDNTATLSISRLSAYPVLKAEYHKVRTFAENVQLLYVSEGGNTWSSKSTTVKNLKTYISTDPDEKYFVTYFTTRLYANSTSSQIYGFSGTKSKIPRFMREMYFNNDVEEWIDAKRNVGTWFGTSRQYWSVGSKSFMPFESYGTKSATFPISTGGNNYTHCHTKKQIFDDVSYHWEPWVFQYMGGVYNELSEGRRLPATSGSSFTVYIGMRLIIDYHTYDDIYKAYHAAILHECAFIGFEVIDDTTNFSNTTGGTGIYTPLFDYEHMITTGGFKTGTAATSLPNATWGDIFDDGMPTYDPHYIPPEPVPDEHDRGDLYNQGARRFFWNSLKVHLLSVANYDQFIQKLNSLNMTDPDNETWQLQFKGLNPSDYIVGAYASFVKPPKSTASNIVLGPVDLEQSEYTYKESDDNAGFFTFGTRTINPEFNDFRDFAPYTVIELYLPLCGTIELDSAYFMGASVKIDYYYDIYTMSCTACIYRVKDNQELLYKTVNGTIGAQIPMLSGNMGAYQNQIKSIENAMKQNEMKVLTSTAVLAAGIVAAPMTSGTSLIAAGTAALSGAAGIASGLQKQAELDYQIEHIQPSMSVTGAADPQTDLCTGQLMPKLIIKRAEMLSTYNQAEYAKTIGHACCINDILGYIEGDTESPRSGLVVCSSVDTSGISQTISEGVYISPTADEVNMIKQALSSGVIL